MSKIAEYYQKLPKIEEKIKNGWESEAMIEINEISGK